MKIYDISQELLTCNVYEGDPVPIGTKIKNVSDDGYNLSCISMCAHNGTHIDAPYHFLDSGNTVDKMDISAFVGECYVVSCTGDISQSDAQSIVDIANCPRILIKGDATITADAAKVLADANILIVGCEGQSVGDVNAPAAVHKILLSQNIALLEGIVLKDIPCGKYFLSCAPLNIAGFDGSPCRATLIDFFG